MRAQLGLVLLVTISGLFKTSDAGGWTNTYTTPKQLVNNKPLAPYSVELCGYPSINALLEVRNAINEFNVQIYKLITLRAKDHCILTSLNLWLTLAAMAEGSEGLAQQELFKILNLPEDVCLRQRYYEIAIKSDISRDGVIIHTERILAIDESLQLNPFWNNFVGSNALLDSEPMPIRRDSSAVVETMRHLIAARIPNINLAGNSVLLGSFDYQGPWSSLFSDAIINRSPFYNDFDTPIGTVEMMTIKKRAIIAYLPEQQLKILVLPVGYNARYCIMVALSMGNTRGSIQAFTGSVVPDVLRSMRLSSEPIEVAIPRYLMRTELDIRGILEDMGVKSLWSDPLATRNISTPAAFPSSFIHRATITIDNAGTEMYDEASLKTIGNVRVIDEAVSGVHPVFGRDFIANRPFMFALFDTESYICIFASIFSHPPDSQVPLN